MTEGKQVLVMQYIAAICASIGAMYTGSTMGFTAPVGPLLANENSTLHLSEMQISWFTSSLNLGGLVGSLCAGHFMNFFGRRGTLMLLGMPAISGWILMAFSPNFSMLLFARLIHGFGNGIVTAVVPAYVGEISSPKIRGMLGSILPVMIACGIMYVYVVGALIKNILWISLICIPVPIVLICAMYFLPESPTFLMMKNKTMDAERSLQKLNGIHSDISLELKSLSHMTTDSHVKESVKTKLMKLAAPSGYKPLSITIILFFFLQFGGITAIIFNLGFIFEASGSTLSNDVSTIIFISLEVVACLAGMFLMDRAGRKPLLIISALGMMATLGFLGIFFYLKKIDDEWNLWTSQNLFWLPLVCLGSYVILFCVGIGPVPFVLCGEIYSPDLQGISSSISSFAYWMSAFLVTLTFFPLKNIIDDHGIYWVYGSFCLLAALFSYFCVTETKGKTAEEIAQIYK